MDANTEFAEGQQATDLAPIDKNGRPTTYLSFRILKLMFSQPSRFYTPNELAKLLAAKHSDADSICRQLKRMDLLTEDTAQPRKYKYNLNSINVDIQTEFECFLADVELNKLPVHLMLDYSPSFPSHDCVRALRC